MRESPRWLASKGRYAEADAIVTRLEQQAIASGHVLEAPKPLPEAAAAQQDTNWRELFTGIYRKRTLSIWVMWFTSYMVGNGMITWLPTLYRQTFNLPLETSLEYGLYTAIAGVISSIICALLIDRVGRKRWYAYAITQTVTYSLYLYSAEIYPTRLRALGTGLGSAWLRLGSSAGPLVVGSTMAYAGIQYVFALFAVILLIGAAVTILFATETKGQALEELSP